MFTEVKEYLYPKTVAEAVELLSSTPNSRIVAGGTNITLLSDESTTTLVDLQQLPLKYVKVADNSIEIGALTTITDMIEFCKTKEVMHPVFLKALSQFANNQIRNMATIGGNIARSYGWAILPVLLLSFNARIHIIGRSGGLKKLASDDFFALSHRLEKDEIITHITIPIIKNVHAVYDKLVRTVTDYALINCLVYAENVGNALTNVRVAIASVVKQPQRLTELEKQLTNLHSMSDEQIMLLVKHEVAKLALVVTPIVTEAYRREVLTVKIARGLISAKNGEC